MKAMKRPDSGMSLFKQFNHSLNRIARQRQENHRTVFPETSSPSDVMPFFPAHSAGQLNVYERKKGLLCSVRWEEKEVSFRIRPVSDDGKSIFDEIKGSVR